MRSLRFDRLAAALPLVALLAAGCRLGVTGILMPDAGGDAMNGPPDGPVCLPIQAFGTPMPFPGLNADLSSVQSVRFTPDELSIYLSIVHGNQVEIIQSSRARRTDPPGPWSVLHTLIMNGDAGYNDAGYPTVTARAFSIYFSSTRLGHPGLFVSTRTHSIDQFSDPIEVAGLGVGDPDAPYVLPDGSALYFQARGNGTNLEIYRAANDGTGFGAAASLEINSAADESMPVVSPDELTIYFFRHGYPNYADGVWTATRSSATDSFGPAAPLDKLNMPFPAAKPIWISPDGCRLYLQEEDPQASFFVYYAERTP